MKLAVGSDERTHVTDWIVEELRARGVEVDLHGALKPGADSRWPEVASSVAMDVAGGRCDQGILFCWTGTGVSIAANKVPGIRAALCTDAGTAKGARMWNDANILCMSLCLASQEVVREILDAWSTTTEIDESERENIQQVNHMGDVNVVEVLD